MLKTIVEIAAYSVAAMLSAVCILAWAWKWGGWSWSVVSRQLRRSVLAVMVAMAVVATIKAQKGNRGNGTTGDPPDPVQQTGTTGVSPVANPATNTLHFSAIALSTNGTVTLTAAWPTNFLTADQTLDVLRKESLYDERWSWLTNGVVEAGANNMSWTIENQSPSNSFYKAVVRDSLTDMDDPDGDGLPNVYELAHGTNPWLNDYALVQKLTVGPNGEFSDIFSALAESEDYSIIAVTSGTYQVNGGVQMPPHPVMVTCENGYAVFSGASQTAMFLLGNGHQSGHTLFRNLYLNLASTSGLQAGFWCGGVLPWVAPGVSAVFENVHIRAPNPGVEYFGWLFYAPCDVPAVIRGCCVNASDAEWIYAVFGDNPPPIVVESCTFVNFPHQSLYQSAAIGLRSTYTNGAITSTPPVTVSRTLFDDSFTNAWPLVRFENASGFSVTMTDCIRPSEPASPDFMPDVTNDVHVLTSQVVWAGFPLTNSLAAALGIGAFTPLAYDPLADMDNDGISDYEEVFDCGTDPWLVDSDGDGVPDGCEITEGTDPADIHSVLQHLTLTATNTVSLAFPVRVAWGNAPTGWDTNGLAVFPQGFGAKNCTNEASQVTRYARAFCDFNGDGEYDAGHDILLVRAIPNVGMVQVDFVFGDVDGDGLSDYDEIYTHGTNPLSRDTDGDGVHDGDEISEGTDPTNSHSFAQIQYVLVTNTASLVHSVYLAWGYSDAGWETNGLAAFPFGFGDMVYTNASPQGATHVKAFCDIDDNGEYDADIDILIVRSIPVGSTAHFSFIFGDVDHDGVPDAQELQEGTDPYDANNFRLKARFRFTDHDVGHGCTNFVAVTLADSEWDLSDVVMRSAAGTFEYSVDTNVTGGAIYVKCLHDRDGDGLLDVGLEGIRTNRLFRSVGTDTPIEVSIGDYDYDGVSDSVELGVGTDPFNGRNYCFNLSLTYTDVFQTTNALTFTATFGTNCVYGPCVVEGRIWSHDFGHCVAVNGERAAVNVWDDANQNGQWDVGETSNRYVIAVTSHDMVVTNALPYQNFDRNYNELPDWWETQEGLDAEGVARRMYDDPDGDGLINLHEFWCGTHPLVPDGSNTLLSVASRSIDDRIRDVDPSTSISRFVDYFANGATNVFIANTNFWARDLDLSCVSVWHSGDCPGSMAAMLITRRHVVMARHWYTENYTFCDTNGQVCTRLLLRSSPISDDLLLGQLNAPLPDSFKPASVMSTNYVHYLSTGRYLPTLCLNQEKGATVLELEDLNCRVLENGGPWHIRYGKTSMTNYVSTQRNNIRGATPGGDSGCPVFLVVGNELVLLFSKHLGSKDEDRWCHFWGPTLSFRLEAIQNKINEWEGSGADQYQIVPFDLSVFPEIVNQR